MQITPELLNEYITRINDADTGFYAKIESDGEYILFSDQNTDEDYFEEIEIPNNFDALLSDIRARYDYFDPDEHVEMWIEAKHNGVSGVPSIRELVEESEQIEADLEDLYMESQNIIYAMDSDNTDYSGNYDDV